MFNILNRNKAESMQDSALQKVIDEINQEIEKRAKMGEGYCSVDIPWGSQQKLKELYTRNGYDVDWYRTDKGLWSCSMTLSISWEK